MSNTNCLAGMRCPECKSEEPFLIETKAIMTVYDSGTESLGDTEWDEDSYCECVKCRYSGKVFQFQILFQEIQLVNKTEPDKLPLLIDQLTTAEGKKELERKLKQC